MKTLRKGLAVLRELAASEEPVGVTELARRLDLDKASAHRMLAALVDEGFAEQDEDSRRYTLGLAVVDLATARLRSVSVAGTALPHIEALRDELNETVALVVPDGVHFSCATVCESRQTVRVSFFVGERIPLLGSACGVAWLATVSEAMRDQAIERRAPASNGKFGADVKQLLKDAVTAKRNGYAVKLDSMAVGAGAVAVPIVGVGGDCAGILVVGAQSINLGTQRSAQIGQMLVQVASRIQSELRTGSRSTIRRIL